MFFSFFCRKELAGSWARSAVLSAAGLPDAVGKPLLFGTTDTFLKKFNISSLKDLPDYEQLLERIKVLHEESDNSLFDFREIPEEEDIAKNMSDEEAEQITEQTEASGSTGSHWMQYYLRGLEIGLAVVAGFLLAAFLLFLIWKWVCRRQHHG